MRKNAALNIILTLVMGLMVTFGNELIRYNPSNKRIEYSTNRGSSWYTRSSSSSIGNVKALIVYGNELLLCSDKGVMYSTNKGASWYTRTTSHRDFIDMQDAGKELLATTSDGHLYYSTNKGASWYRRR
ncbi:MAG: hypothetical protein MJY67_00820 [Bacteroidales bacterium]|nr:hypothetical protein [Bacteroidales bacterium]